MLATLLIVFREVIEAGLIVGIVLAASKGAQGRGLWVACGIMGGLAGAAVVAFFAGQLSMLFEGSGQELFNAAVLTAATCMLTWHNVWMARHGRAMAAEMRGVGADIAAGRRPPIALMVVVAVAVMREGSEVALFLYGIAVSGGTTAGAMLAGGLLGVLAGAGVTALMYFGLLAIPAHRLFAATSGLITLLAAGLAAQAMAFVQAAGTIDLMSDPVWDSSWLLSEDSLIGRVLHTLIGYTAQPSGAQLIVYGLTIAVIVALMRLTSGPKSNVGGKASRSD